jgi:flagellin-like protein
MIQGQDTQAGKMARSRKSFDKFLSFSNLINNNNFFSQKKAISPVVATALLLVVAVVAVVTFQGWFGNLESSIFSDVEIKSNSATDNTLSVDSIVGNTLYVKNNVEDNLSINDLKIGDIVCNVSKNLSLGMNEVDVSSCINNVSISTPDVVIITDNQVVQKSVFLKDAKVSSDSSSGSGDEESILSSSLSCDIDSDGDNYFDWTCANYPMTNTTFEGKFDLDDNFDEDSQGVTVDYNCWLKGDKSSCEDNFVVDGCGTGTVLDLGTGLCWQRNMSTAGQRTWENAKTYCSGLSLGGHSNWYLPSRQELVSITDLSRSSPAIVGGNNKFTNVQGSHYWSVSTYSPNTAYAWPVDFGYGGGANIKTYSNYVTCVVRNS